MQQYIIYSTINSISSHECWTSFVFRATWSPPIFCTSSYFFVAEYLVFLQVDPFFFFLYTLIRYEYLWRIFFFLLTLQRSVLLNIILHIYGSYSMNFYLKGSLLFSERHYRVNSEEEERDISAKRRKKTNEGVARSRGWVIDGRQSVRSWTRRKLIRVGRKFN